MQRDAARENSGDDARHLIETRDWKNQRFGWLEGVRRDASLSPTAQIVAHVLALDFANRDTMRCDPSFRELALATGRSEDTMKRAVKALMHGGWLTFNRGLGRTNHSTYRFLTRAKIVALKGGRFAPQKGGRNAGFSDPKKGADLHEKGGKSASGYNIAKPYKNHNACTPTQPGAPATTFFTETERAAADNIAVLIRAGRSVRSDLVSARVRQCLIAENHLTADELETHGLAEKGKGKNDEQ